MKYVELVEKIDAVAENLKRNLRELEIQMFNEDKKKLRAENGKIIIARIENDDDDYYVGFPANPDLPIDLCDTHLIVVERGQTLYRLKTTIKTMQFFFIEQPEDIPYNEAIKKFGWHWFKVNYTPLREVHKIIDFLEETVSKAFSFLNKEERRFVSSLADVLWNNLNMEVPAKDVAACINEPFDDNRSWSFQIWEMYQSNSKQKSVKDNNKLVEQEDNIPF